MKLEAWLGVARAPFLVLPVTLIAAGAAAAAYEGRFGWLPTLVALVGLIALHIAVNAYNEASDMTVGIDLNTLRTPFSGGSGTLPAGRLTVGQARAFATANAILGGLIGVWFATRLEWTFLLLLAGGAIAVLLYSPYMTRLGIGEVFAGLGLGLLPVWGAAWVQGVFPGPAGLWAGVPAFFMTFNLLLLNEFPDEQADRAGGRRHLVILLGRKGAARVYAVAALLTPLSIVLAVILGALPVYCLAAALPSLLLVQALGWAMSRPQEAVPLPALGSNVIWNLSTNALLALALVVARLRA